MEKLHIDFPVIVEGKYDKIKLDSILDAVIITTEGFKIFRDTEKRALLRALAEKSKIIVLSDSDHAGMMIRSHIKGIIPNDRIISLYAPQIVGKEKRKAKPSKEGFVGVEGTDADLLRELFRPFANANNASERKKITKTDLYELGLSGGSDSSKRRAAVCKALGLPCDLSANALLETANVICSFDEFIKTVKESEL